MNDLRGRRKRTGIRKIAWIFFLLYLSVCAAGVGMIFLIVDQGQTSRGLVASMDSPSQSGDRDDALQREVKTLVERTRARMILILIICLSALATAVFFLARRIFGRLEKVTLAAQQVAQGDFKATAEMNLDDEIGQIGEAINDLAANLQEMLLYLWNHSNHCLSLIDRVGNKFEKNPGLQDDLPKEVSEDLNENFRHIKEDLQEMQAMIKTFEFYDISLESGKVTTHSAVPEKDNPRKGDYHD